MMAVMRIVRMLSAVLAGVLVSASLSAQFVHTKGKELLDGNGRPLLLRGTNLGNWMEPEGYMWHLDKGPESAREINDYMVELIGPTRTEKFWKQWRDTYISEQDIRQIKAAGFNSIRVPMNWRLFTSDNAEGFFLTDRLIKWASAQGLYVVLDMHAAPGGNSGTNIDDSYGYPWLFEDEGAQAQLIEIWTRIAKRYKNEKWVLGYDLLNEPIPNVPAWEVLNPRLEPLYKRVTAAIRTVDKKHTIILGGAQWDQNLAIFGMPFDSNILYQVHTYKSQPTDDGIKRFLVQRDRLNAPIWMGETGENTDAWVAQMRETLERNNVGWCYWPYKKMDATTAPVTFARPDGWDQIVAYGKYDRKVGQVRDRLKYRPEQKVIDTAFEQLLNNIKFENTKRNMGYIRALLPDTKLQ